MKKRTLIIAGTLSFLLASLTQLPASLVLSKLPANLPVQLQGINGTLWQGGAASLNAQGLQINNLQWDLRLSPLLKGHLAADLRGNLAQGGQFDGICSINLGGTLHCNPLNITALPAQALTPYVQSLMIPPLSGTFQANLSSLEWDQQTLPQIKGTANGNKQASKWIPNAMARTAPLSATGKTIPSRSRWPPPPMPRLPCNGTVTLRRKRPIPKPVNLKPGNSIDAGTKQLLSSLLVPPQPDGSYQIRETGKLP